MGRWTIITSGATLWSGLFIFLVVTPQRMLLAGIGDNNSPQIRTTWCEVTNVCTRCEATERLHPRPRCLEYSEPLVSADLCECCFSCVAVRELGESCGSQLSVLFEDNFNASTDLNFTTLVLATSRCKEGLICSNFVCKNFSTSSLTTWSSESTTIASTVPTEIHLETEKTESCFEKDEELVILKAPDDSLGREVTVTLGEKRFQIIYTGDLPAELKVLLKVVDKLDPDSHLGEDTTDSFVKAFLNSFVSQRDVMKSSSSRDCPKLNTASKAKRGIEERDVARFDAPKNIQEILIRGASAHREYTDEDRIYASNTTSSDRNSSAKSAEASSQGDESTLHVQITTRPGKVKTLIDLEEENHENNRGQFPDDLDPVYGRKNMNTGKPPSLITDARDENSPMIPMSLPRTTIATNILRFPQTPDIRWNKTMTDFSDRLMGMEFRIGVLERVLEEMAKWCNLGVVASRDCLIPQNAGIRVGQWGSAYVEPERRIETDERMALPSGVNAVRLRGGQRKLTRKDDYDDVGVLEREIGRVAAASRDNIFRDIIRAGSRQFQGTGKVGRPMIPPMLRVGGRQGSDNRRLRGFLRDSTKLPCKKSMMASRERANHGLSWRKPIAQAIDDPLTHRAVRRSVRSVNPLRSISSEDRELESRDRTTQTLETQIPRPRSQPVVLDEVMTEDFEKQESTFSKETRIKLQGCSSPVREGSIDTPSWRMFVAEKDAVPVDRREEKKADPISRSNVETTRTGRPKRSINHDDGISGLDDALRKVRARSSVTRQVVERATKLFEQEKRPRDGGDSLVKTSWSKGIAGDNNARGRLAVPLIVTDNNSDFQNLPATMASQVLFKNAVVSNARSSSSTEELRGSLATLYAITSHGNSTIRIEEIDDTEYDDNPQRVRVSPRQEDDFDHIYESVEMEDGDFDYTDLGENEAVAYDEVEYIDASNVEVVTETPSRSVDEFAVVEEPKTELGWSITSPNDRIHVVFDHERSRRAPRNDSLCKSGKVVISDDEKGSIIPETPTKRELPLLLFGSGGKRDSKTIVWPSKWAGYRRDKFRMELRESAGSKSQTTQRPGLMTASSPPIRTIENLDDHSKDGEPHAATLKTLGLERRGRKNRRKLVW